MKKIAYALAALLAAGVAQADEAAHAYVSIAGGVTQISADCSGITSCDKSDTGGKVVAGYSFGNGFGLEAGYVSFGKLRATDGTLRATVGNISTAIKPAALTVGGVFTLPLDGEWGMNFRLGVGRVKTKFDSTVGTDRVTGSDTKTKFYGGLAVTYALSPSVKLELGLDTTHGELYGNKGSLRLVSLGARFAF